MIDFSLQKDLQTAVVVTNTAFCLVFQAHLQFHFWISLGTIPMGNSHKAHGITGPSVLTLQRHPDGDTRRLGDGQASTIFSKRVLEHLFVKRQIRNQSLELRVLVFKLRKLLGLSNTHTRVDFLPQTERRLGNAHLPANLANRCPRFRWPQCKRDLLI